MLKLGKKDTDEKNDEGGEDEKEAKDTPAEDNRSPEEKAADEERARIAAEKRGQAYATAKTPPKGQRLFRFIAQNVTITNDNEKIPVEIYAKFILGRTKRIKMENGKKKTVGKKGIKMKTEVWKKLKPHAQAISAKIYEGTWKGEYVDLGNEMLKIEIWDWDRWTPDDLVCDTDIRLIDLAKGSVQQTIEFKVVDDDGLESPYCTMTAEILFNEVFPFQLEFNEWRGSDLKASDSSIFGSALGSSDPYIKFSIAKTRPFKKGFYYGRSTKTEVQRNTLYPVFSNCKKPLYYTGTRAELDNEMLRIDAYDWDFGKRDDLIGRAMIPMAGILEVGFMQVQLSLEDTDPEDKKVKIVKEHGMVQGFIVPRELPFYNQVGQPVVLKDGINYLAIKIVNAEQLRAADVNGTSDPYFMCEWDGSRQQTPVQMKTLNPTFEHTLYFAIKAHKISQAILEKKGSVKITCLDWDESGSMDLLGKCELGLDKITSSFPAAQEHHETRGRMYIGVLPLKLPGIKSESTVSIKAWFEPEIPNEIRLSSTDVVKPSDLPKRYRDRYKAWKVAFPKRADPSRLAKYTVSGLDEENMAHFLCEYINPMKLPHEDMFPIQPVTPNVLARMVRNITFASDEDCLNVKEKEFWVSPNFFMDMKKGDADAHAVFLCNLFLGMSLDAYVCVGKFGKEGTKHAWVMTREPNGSVLFWETMKGRPYVLKERWKGMFRDDIDFQEEDEAENDNDAPEDQGKRVVVRKKIISDEEQKLIDDQEREMIFLDEDDVYNTARIRKDANTDAEDRLPDNEEEMAEKVAEELNEDDDADDGDGLMLAPVPAASVPYNTLEFVFNNINLWANIQAPNPARITYNFEDSGLWSAFIDGNMDGHIKPFYEARATIGPPLPQERADIMANEIRKEIEEAVKLARNDKGMDTSYDKKIATVLEGGLFKLENSYAKWSDVAKRDFDAWKGRLIAACPNGYKFEGVPVSFAYTDVKRIRKFLLKRYPYHENTADKVKFALAAKVIPYPMTTVSVWVYWASLVPLTTNKSSGKKK